MTNDLGASRLDDRASRMTNEFHLSFVIEGAQRRRHAGAAGVMRNKHG
jgi:hypothetical protein